MLQHAESLVSCCLRIQTENLCTKVFVHWKQVTNSESSHGKSELVKFTSHESTES
jgi:hypothetical protein